MYRLGRRTTQRVHPCIAPTFRTPRNKGNKQPNPGASVQIQQLVDRLSQIACSSEVMNEVRNRVSGLASPGDSAADKQRRLGDLLDRQGRAQSHLAHLQGVRDRLQEKCTVSAEAVVKQEALLADQVLEAKLATKTPPKSDNGGAESAVDSDLKWRKAASF